MLKSDVVNTAEKRMCPVLLRLSSILPIFHSVHLSRDKEKYQFLTDSLLTTDAKVLR